MKVRPNVRRKRKRREEGARRANAFLKAALRHWGLWDDFCRRPEGARRIAREGVCKKKHAQPKVTLTEAARGTRHADAIDSEVSRLLEDVARRSVPTVAPRDWFAFAVPTLVLMEMLMGGRSGFTSIETAGDGPLAAVVRQREALFDLLNDLVYQVGLGVLGKRSRIDTGLFWLRPAELPFGFVLEIGYSSAQVLGITVAGQARRAYRSGVVAILAPELPPYVWNDWPAWVLPGGAGQQVYPVYVQSHALRRLEERMDAPESSTTVHVSLGDSLRDPVLSPGRRAGEYLVEYRVNGRRFGYLVAELVGNEILVRTFKFLTMQGTPEGDRLKSLLSLDRLDLAHHRLDRWSTFARSDLKEDRELVNLFSGCGCGQLFDPPDELLTPGCQAGVSDYLRRYLRMPPRE